MNHRMIRYTLGWLLLFEALFLLAPVLTALIYRERVLAAFLWTVAACLCVGLFLVRKRPKNTTLYSREGFLIVAFSWILLSLFGCLPFYISKEIRFIWINICYYVNSSKKCSSNCSNNN